MFPNKTEKESLTLPEQLYRNSRGRYTRTLHPYLSCQQSVDKAARLKTAPALAHNEHVSLFLYPLRKDKDYVLILYVTESTLTKILNISKCAALLGKCC